MPPIGARHRNPKLLHSLHQFAHSVYRISTHLGHVRPTCEVIEDKANKLQAHLATFPDWGNCPATLQRLSLKHSETDGSYKSGVQTWTMKLGLQQLRSVKKHIRMPWVLTSQGKTTGKNCDGKWMWHRSRTCLRCLEFSDSFDSFDSFSHLVQEWRNAKGDVITFDHLSGEIGFVTAWVRLLEAQLVLFPTAFRWVLLKEVLPAKAA